MALEWAEALEGFLSHVPIALWMNHPANNARASHKLEQVSRAAALGLKVPETIVTQEPAEAAAFWGTCHGKVVVKPLASGFIERDDGPDSLIYTSCLDSDDLVDIAAVENCPTLLQRRIEKDIDVRICFVDRKFVAAGLRKKDSSGHQILDIRRDNMKGVEYFPVDPPSPVADCLSALVKSYDLRFAAVDMVVGSNGDWFFLEVNPNGQWAWLDIAGGFDVGSLFMEAFRLA